MGLRGGRGVYVRGELEDLVAIATDVGAAAFVELADVHGEAFWVRAADIDLIAPAKVVPLEHLLAEARGPRPGERLT